MAQSHTWKFKSRFRREAYGWRGSSLASKRLKEAVSEIKKVARSDPVVAGDGAVSLMERLWPSLCRIDGSSGSLGKAVKWTVEALVPLLIRAPADLETRAAWMERLYVAVQEDGVQYLWLVEDKWAQISVFPELAGQWADRLLPVLQAQWADGNWVSIPGSSICLSSLLETGRFDELRQVLLLLGSKSWGYDEFWGKALVRQGKTDEAIAYAEAHVDDRYDNTAIFAFCERVLIEAGRSDEAYQRYGVRASVATTKLAVFRAVCKKYPDREPRQVLQDLIEASEDKGKWFAAAKHAGCYDIALECARQRSAEPTTLIRAARDFAETRPKFAARVALYAIENLLAGGGYEPEAKDIVEAYDHLMAAAARLGQLAWANAEIENLLARTSHREDDCMRNALATRKRLDALLGTKASGRGE